MRLSETLSMYPSSLAWLPLISGVLMVTTPAMAQEDPLAAKRAINLARNSAAAANGGLRLYHPASCMFKDPTDSLYSAKVPPTSNSGSRTSSWGSSGATATVESTVLIGPDEQTVIQELHQEIGTESPEHNPTDRPFRPKSARNHFVITHLCPSSWEASYG